MKTLLQIVQSHCGRTGIAVPIGVMSSTDDQIIQMVGMLNEGLEDLRVKGKWPQLQVQASFTSTATESQGSMETIAPGYLSMIPNTFWNLTKRQRVSGSIDANEAQRNKVLGVSNSWDQYRIAADELRFYPTIEAAQSLAFQYRTKYLIRDADTGLLKEFFTKDTDTTVLPASLHVLDLRWRWKAEKGLAYAENFRTFETICKQTLVDSLNAMPLSLNAAPKNAEPGIVIPAGNW